MKEVSWINTKQIQFSSVQSPSRVRLFATPWIAAHQASLSITNSWSLLKLMPIELVMPSSHLILYRPLLLLPPTPPSIRVFPVNQIFTCLSRLLMPKMKKAQLETVKHWNTGMISRKTVTKMLTSAFSNQWLRTNTWCWQSD